MDNHQRKCIINKCILITTRACMSCGHAMCEKHTHSPLLSHSSQTYIATRFICSKCVNKEINGIMKLVGYGMGTFCVYYVAKKIYSSSRSDKIALIGSYATFAMFIYVISKIIR